MGSIQIPKPVGIAIALAITLLLGGGLWNKMNPTISKEFQMQDAERMRREEGDPTKLQHGATPQQAPTHTVDGY